MSQPDTPISSPKTTASQTSIMADVVESELPEPPVQEPVSTRSAEPPVTAASSRPPFLSTKIRKRLSQGLRYGAWVLLWGSVGFQAVRQQAQQQQLAELESALIARLPAGLTTSVEALRQQMASLDARLQVLPTEMVSRADWQAGVDTQQRNTQAALETLNGQLQRQIGVSDTQVQSLRTLQGAIADLKTLSAHAPQSAALSAKPAAAKSTSPKATTASKTSSSSTSASARQSVPFVLTGIEQRGRQVFAVVAPPTGQGLAELRLVAPGSAVQGWRLVSIEGQQARFLPPNGTKPHVLSPQ